MPASSDLRLAERARAGEADALAELYGRYWRTVRAIAYRLTESLADADDVVQDVFIALPDALRSFEGSGTLEAWLRTVAARRSLLALRQRNARRESRLDAIARDHRVHEPEPTIDRIVLERAVSALPERLRVVFILHAVHGFKHHEISDMLGIGVNGSKARLHRAIKQLRILLRSDR